MICPKRKFIFIHIQKTAGRSVRYALRPHCYTKGQELTRFFDPLRVRLGMQPSEFPKSRYSKLRGHPTAEEYVNVMGDSFYDYFRFTFVRNPFDRLISFYNWLRRDGAIDAREGFADFVRRICQGELLLPQSDHIFDKSGQSLVNFIGYVERIEADFQTITSRLNLDLKLPHVNKSARKYCQYFDERSLEIAQTYYRADLVKFNYGYEGQ